MAKPHKPLIEQIRAAKTVMGVQRVVAPVIARRPLGRGVARVMDERVRELSAAGKLGVTRKRTKVEEVAEELGLAVA